MAAMTTLYGIPNCDTVKRARAWLDEHGVAYTFHDFKKQGVPEAELDQWLKKPGWEALVNRKGTTWRKLDDATRNAWSTPPRPGRCCWPTPASSSGRWSTGAPKPALRQDSTPTPGLSTPCKPRNPPRRPASNRDLQERHTMNKHVFRTLAGLSVAGVLAAGAGLVHAQQQSQWSRPG
jgi:hypothetical protein